MLKRKNRRIGLSAEAGREQEALRTKARGELTGLFSSPT
jgi:hypothetical protein